MRLRACPENCRRISARSPSDDANFERKGAHDLTINLDLQGVAPGDCDRESQRNDGYGVASNRRIRFAVVSHGKS